MLQNKDTIIVSELKDFFTSSEKAINSIFTLLSSLKLSEKYLRIESKNNNEARNINKPKSKKHLQCQINKKSVQSVLSVKICDTDKRKRKKLLTLP